ncbi:MAG: aspartate carbamoyltransferase [Gammaproteobacteria bacterium RIFCSPHIGHO2_12_FULL_43_28]|nr:MAG: aspartate carbamoyltransferase [Gammaproteobacteria bacterium RIFCSPHIGHO2_12_FULL_43_28]
MTTNSLYGRDVVSIGDLSLAEIKYILDVTAQLKAAKTTPPALTNKLIAHCFFEPSTRTRLSFEAATLRLNGKVIGFSSDDSTSIKKGETLQDTIRVISDYADLIVIRHPKEGAARLAADLSTKPVINAGDGANQHPTQTLLDLFTIHECQQKLDGLAIALVGDLKYGRTAHSFAKICKLFDIRLFLVAPDALTMPDYLCDDLKKQGVRFSFHQSIEEVISKVDIIYMTRIQQERFSSVAHQFNKAHYNLTAEHLINVRPNLRILHPLPRVDEIDVAIDKTPHAYYFEQAANGVFVRQALLALALNKELSLS